MGYIVLDRALFNHWIWEKYGKEWVDLIQLANYEDKTRLYHNEVIVVKRGVVEMNISSLAARWGWSWHKTESFIKLLSEQNMVSVKKPNRRDIFIEIINYDKYQLSPQKTAKTERTKSESENVEKYSVSENGKNKQSEKSAIKKRSKSGQKANIPIKEIKEINKINQDARAREGNPETDWFFVQASPELSEAVNRWIAYKHERRQPYKPIGLNTLLRKISEKAKEHGDAAVIEIIDQSIASQYQGIVWDKIKRQTRIEEMQSTYDALERWANT